LKSSKEPTVTDQRGEDLEGVAEHFLYSEGNGKPVEGFEQ
jgi:hypothetical protein